MSSKTTNLNLTKPSEDEFYDINVQNENMDIIDREIGGLKQPAYEVPTAMSDLHSGEMITVAFGKIAKAVSTLISHTTSKATNSVLGHVKLSDSTSSTSASTAGVAATPKAVKAAYDLANSNTEKIGTTDISGIGDGTVTGAIVNNKEAIEDVSQSLTNVNNSKKTYLRLILPNIAVDAKAVCDYINKNYLLGQLSPATTVDFDVVASNADWFTGTLSTDSTVLAAGRTVWGFVQQRTSSAENSTLYKYFASGTGGAGSVSALDHVKSFIDVSTILKSYTTIAAGATVTYTATRDCFVNVSAYAHGSGQNTKIYINNVPIFNPYTNNGDNAGLMIVDKTVPLKTGQTIKIENGTYTTSSYAIFAAF